MRIFINPGHCPGYDSGAVNRNFNLYECDIVKEISEYVVEYLEARNQTVKCLQTDNLRNNPKDDSLDQPCIITECNSFQANLAVSIHLNAFNGVAHGSECICFARGSAGECLAKCIQDRLIDTLHTFNRGVRYEIDKDPDYRLSFIMLTDMPAVIVECGFIDNDDDCKKIVDNKRSIAKAIADGIMEYINVWC